MASSQEIQVDLVSHLHFNLNELHCCSVHRDLVSGCVEEGLQKSYLYKMSYRISSSFLSHFLHESLAEESHSEGFDLDYFRGNFLPCRQEYSPPVYILLGY